MVNIYKPKLTLLQQDILRLLFIKSGASLNQRAIARELKVTPPAVMKSIPGLERENLIIVRQDKESRRWAIELKRDNYKALQLKRVDNLKQIYESGLANFLEREIAGSTIILFGSYAKGEDMWFGNNDDKNSDIDIAIIGRNEKKMDLRKIEDILLRKINLQFFDSWKNIHKYLKNNILNGIIISGSVDL